MPKYSDGLVLTWQVAAYEAHQAGFPEIEPGHFFVALCKIPDLRLEDLVPAMARDRSQRWRARLKQEFGELHAVYREVDLNPGDFRRKLRAVLGTRDSALPGEMMHRAPESRTLFRDTERLCESVGGSLVRPAHLLWGLCELDSGPWLELLAEAGIDRQGMVDAIRRITQPDGAEVAREEARREPGVDAEAPQRRRTPYLERYGRDLTQLAREGRLHKVIGRRDEILRLGQVLLKKEANNAILVGDAGVGKTCVVEGFAQRIIEEDASDLLKDRRIVEVQMADVVAGARYRGDFEERLRGLLKEVAENPEVVLFMDEIHTALGAGSAGTGDTMDAANIMKPALDRGGIACMGATTTAEYRRFVERDAAFSRRFEVIWVEEPTRAEAVEILLGLRPSLQEHHGCAVSDDAIDAAVELSMRYATDRRLPDKAVDLVDETCAQVRLQSIRALHSPREITREDVAKVASGRYRVPLEALTQDEKARLLALEDTLRKRVKGQDQALSVVGERIRTARAGLVQAGRPRGVFLFLGPTGTGKTELAKALAGFLHGERGKLIQLDMSEYSEKHQITRLIGAPPSYVGYEDEGQLTSEVRTNPFSVVLLDEIEKAAPEVHRLFLQVFDEGRLTDSHARKVSFAETTIIMTSNMGYSGLGSGGKIGFHAQADEEQAQHVDRDRVMAAVQRALPPEFLNRIDRIVFFNPIGTDTAREIIDKFTAEVEEQLASHSVRISLASEAYDLIAEASNIEQYGARDLRRTIDRLIAEPLSKRIVQGELAPGSHVRIGVVDGKVSFEIAESA